MRGVLHNMTRNQYSSCQVSRKLLTSLSYASYTRWSSQSSIQMSSKALRLLFNRFFNNFLSWVGVTLMEIQKLGSSQTTSLQRRDTLTIRCSSFSGNFGSGMQRAKICESSSVGRRLIAGGLPLIRSLISSFCASISLWMWESLSPVGLA